MKLVQKGDKIFIADIQKLTGKLKPAVYMLRLDPIKGEHYLSIKEELPLPKKVYGEKSHVEKWVKYCKKHNDRNTGIVLSGLKGSGKTVDAKLFCLKMNLPVILQTESFDDEVYKDFITSPLLGRFILFIDEFEKVYSDDRHTRTLLTIMDGVFKTSIIFLLTCNTTSIDTYMTNRLGRVRYNERYMSLSNDIITEMCNDMLINKSEENIKSVITFVERIGIGTIDLVVNIIDEMNLLGVSAIEAAKGMNLVREPKQYAVTELFEGKEYPCYSMSEDAFDDVDDSLSIRRFDCSYLPDSDKTTYLTFPLREAKLEYSKTSITITYKKFKFLLKEKKFLSVF